MAHDDRGIPLIRRFNDLLDEYDAMAERVGGWRIDIPAEELAAWEEHKEQLIDEMERVEYDRRRRDARLTAIAALSTVSL